MTRNFSCVFKLTNISENTVNTPLKTETYFYSRPLRSTTLESLTLQNEALKIEVELLVFNPLKQNVIVFYLSSLRFSTPGFVDVFPVIVFYSF